MDDQAIEITIIRHGETTNNLIGRFCGRGNYPLAEEGIKFITDMISKYPYEVPEKLFRSPAGRCDETAQLIFPGMPSEVVEDLNEISFGDYEEALASEVYKKDASVTDFFTKKALDSRLPNGESIRECRDRGIRGMNYVIQQAKEHGWKKVAVVTHSFIMSLFLPMMASNYTYTFCPNGMGIIVRVQPDDCEKPLLVVGRAPIGAPVPDMTNNPYVRERNQTK